MNQQCGTDNGIITILDLPNAQVESCAGHCHINSQGNFAAL